MRELHIDFTLDDPLSKGSEAGYIGENNATELVIRPGAKILNSGSKKFVIVFLTQGNIFRSEQFDPAAEFRIKLGAHLTQDHYLSLQLEGYSDNDALICKSQMVTKIHFMPSIQGDECEIDPKDYQIYSQIALNTKSRHSHLNSAVINYLNSVNGELTLNNSPVCKKPKVKTAVLSYENGDFDASLSTSGLIRLDFFSYEGIDDFIVPPDSEIVSVELQIDGEDCPEWLDIRDMSTFDPDNPCIPYARKTFSDPSLTSTVFCRLFFLSSINKFANYITAFLLKKIRISYIENSVS